MMSEMQRIAKIPGAMEPVMAGLSGVEMGGPRMFPLR
jgi:hypothetical protein